MNIRGFRGRLRPLSAALLAIGLASSPALARDPRAPLDLVLTVSVADKSGQPVGKARVTTEGAHGATAMTGSDGRCAIRIPLGKPADLSSKPLTVEVRAQAHGERLALAEGSDVLRVELTVTGTTAAGARVRVRATSERAAAAVAEALTRADNAPASCDVAFIGLPNSAGAEASRFTAEQTVEVAGLSRRGSSHAAADPPAASATKSSATGAAAGAAGHAAAPPAGTQGSAGSKSTAPVKPTVVGTTMQTTRTLPHPISTATSEVPVLGTSTADSTRSGECECRVTGTVEVNWDYALAKPLGVAVWLLDAPAIRDSVRLDMGAPRAFTLLHVPCGSHRLEVGIPKSSRFQLATPAGELLFSCERGAARPLHVVLEPR